MWQSGQSKQGMVMIMMFPMVLVSKGELYSISHMAKKRNNSVGVTNKNSVGVTNARKPHQRETHFPIIPQLLDDYSLHVCYYCCLFSQSACLVQKNANFEEDKIWNRIICWYCWESQKKWKTPKGKRETRRRSVVVQWKSETTQLLSLHCPLYLPPTKWCPLPPKVDSISWEIIFPSSVCQLNTPLLYSWEIGWERLRIITFFPAWHIYFGKNTVEHYMFASSYIFKAGTYWIYEADNLA